MTTAIENIKIENFVHERDAITYNSNVIATR